MSSITIVNHMTFDFQWSGRLVAGDGDVLSITSPDDATEIPAGKSLVLTLQNTSISGELLIWSTKKDDDGWPLVGYKIDYKTFYDGSNITTSMSSMSLTPVVIDVTDGYGAEFDKESYFQTSGGTPSVDAILDLVVLVETTKVPGYVVALGSSPMSAASSNPRVFQTFVNSMFSSNVRARDVVSAQARKVDKNPAPYADFTGGQLPNLVSMWAARWKDSSKDVCPVSDAALIDFLAGFIGRPGDAVAPLDLWIPDLSYKAGSNLVRFGLNGYKRNGFLNSAQGWSDTTITRFLTLLASGAHFVVISAKDDLSSANLSFDSKTTKQMLSSFKSSKLTISDDPGNSHYADHVNTTGRYFLDISGEFAPSTVQYTDKTVTDCGLLLSFLCASTTSSTSDGAYNSFFQLEGWQAQDGVSPPGGARHGADFLAYQETLWNISTFGASPFSERRGTTVFLAPHGWTPMPYQVTCMMPYVGAYGRSLTTPQPWLHADLVSIPDDAPTLSSDFVV